MLRATRRRPLRAVRCPPYGRLGAFARAPQSPPRSPEGLGQLYAALDKGRIDKDALKGLLASHDPGAVGAPVYAVDVSPWPRCDAETSPERVYLYHPSRHSAGQPIVAGWAYQFVARLSFERNSWVAPVGARRVRLEEDSNDVAAEQVKALLDSLPQRGVAPLFVFDAGYDPVRLQLGLEGHHAQILVRLNSGRTFYADPEGPSKRPVERRPVGVLSYTAGSSTSKPPRAGPSLPASTAVRRTTTGWSG